jgi:hypothetical protein
MPTWREGTGGHSVRLRGTFGGGHLSYRVAVVLPLRCMVRPFGPDRRLFQD